MTSVIMTKENKVKTRNLTRYYQRCILHSAIGDDTAFSATMEQTNDNVWFLVLLYIFHPFASCFNHIIETHTAPNLWLQPVRNSWCEHTDNSYLNTIFVQNSIRLHIRLVSLGVNNIGTKHRTLHLTNPFVEHSVSWFNIMVTHALCIIVKIVNYLSSNILILGIDIVIEITCRLSL